MPANAPTLAVAPSVFDEDIVRQEQQLFSDAYAGLALAGPEATARLNNSMIQTQTWLAALGFYNGPINGVQTPQTTAAIKAFQKYQGFPENGELDGVTWGQLKKEGEKAVKDAKKAKTQDFVSSLLSTGANVAESIFGWQQPEAFEPSIGPAVPPTNATGKEPTNATGKEPTNETEKGVNWWLVGGAVAGGTVIVGGLAYLLLRRG